MRRRALLLAAAMLLLVLTSGAGHAADRTFVSSDGVRLHYIEAGTGRTIVLVPGWTMPAWIFSAQINELSRYWHVVAFDPRGQGDSEIAADGYEPFRRGRDIADLLDHLGTSDVLLLGWSLGVLDVLSYVHQFGDRRLSGLVLVDNSVGEDPPPSPGPAAPTSRARRRGKSPAVPREVSMRRFVRGMFVDPPPPGYVDRLTQAALRTPPAAAASLLAYPVPRSFWREAVYSTEKPVLYMVTPRFSGQAVNLGARHPNATTVVFRNVGHAMFVDDPAQFDATLIAFIRKRLWS